MNETQQTRTARKITLTGAFINVFLACIKATGGFLLGSQALIADAIDSTTDLVSDVVTLAAVKISHRPVDSNHPYGHGRFESLASLAIGVILLFAAFSIGHKAFHSLFDGRRAEIHWFALIIAGTSIISKEILFRWTRKGALKIRSRALEANAFHHRSDAISSVTVFVGLLANIVIPGATFMDSVASLLVTLLIVRAAFMIVFEAVKDLTDQVQDPDLLAECARIADSVEEVEHTHRIRTRRYGHLVYVDLDIEVDPNMTVKTSHTIAHNVKEHILAEIDYIADVLIHVEPSGSHLDGEGTVRGTDENSFENSHLVDKSHD